MHFTSPSLKMLLSYGGVHRGAARAPEGAVRPMSRDALDADSLAHRPAAALALSRRCPGCCRISAVADAHLPDVRGPRGELGDVLRRDQLPVARHRGVLRDRRLRHGLGVRARCPTAVVVLLGGLRRGGVRGAGRRRGAAPARRVLRGDHLRPGRAGAPRRSPTTRRAYAGHGRPRHRRAAGVRRVYLTVLLLAVRGGRRARRGAREPLRPRAARHRRRRGARADARRERAARQDRSASRCRRSSPARSARRWRCAGPTSTRPRCSTRSSASRPC